MRRTHRYVRAFSLLTLLASVYLVPMSLRADSIPVVYPTSGTVTAPGIGPDIYWTFSGPSFDITHGYSDSGVRFTQVGTLFCDGTMCVPGSTVEINTLLTSGFMGSMVVDGVTYPSVFWEGPAVIVEGGPVTLPTPIQPEVTVEGFAPFSGTLTACSTYVECFVGGVGTDIAQVDFNTTGVLTATFDYFYVNPILNGYSFTGATWTVTPEPGTLSLLLAGVLTIPGLLLRGRTRME